MSFNTTRRKWKKEEKTKQNKTKKGTIWGGSAKVMASYYKISQYGREREHNTFSTLEMKR